MFFFYCVVVVPVCVACAFIVVVFTDVTAGANVEVETGGIAILPVAIGIVTGVETGVDAGSESETGKTICGCGADTAPPLRSPLKSIFVADDKSNPAAP